MKKERFNIAGGGTTLLVENCPMDQRASLATKTLEREVAEQVGFVGRDAGSVTTMGGELSLNTLLAFAYRQGRTGSFRASGVNGVVMYRNTPEETTVTFETKFRQEGDIVLFEGIGYRYTENMSLLVNQLPTLAERYNKPAFGYALVNRAEPQIPSLSTIVYVEDTMSTIFETACGSASMAATLVTGKTRIRQFRGGIIKTSINGSSFTVSAEVKKLGVLK